MMQHSTFMCEKKLEQRKSGQLCSFSTFYVFLLFVSPHDAQESSLTLLYVVDESLELGDALSLFS